MGMHGARNFTGTVVPLVAVPLAILVMSGCASAPPPVAELSQAHTLVAEAQQSGAARYASADLASAQNNVQQADQAAKEHPAQAARLAQKASVDAEVALARTRANKEQDALKQVNLSLTALRQQLQQTATTDGNAEEPTPAPAQPGNDQQQGGPQE